MSVAEPMIAILPMVRHQIARAGVISLPRHGVHEN